MLRATIITLLAVLWKTVTLPAITPKAVHHGQSDRDWRLSSAHQGHSSSPRPVLLLWAGIFPLGVSSPESSSSGFYSQNLYQLALFSLGITTCSQQLCRYNIGILATIYVNPGFIKALSKPTASQQGLITAIYYLGTWTSYVFLSAMASDRLGRRYAAFTGAIVTCVGAAMQAGAKGKGAFALMIIGRIVCGFGNAIISTSVPLYQRLEVRCSCCDSWVDEIPQ